MFWTRSICSGGYREWGGAGAPLFREAKIFIWEKIPPLGILRGEKTTSSKKFPPNVRPPPVFKILDPSQDIWTWPGEFRAQARA